jgi:peptide/nickel transport system substrate-binding protein
MKKFGKLLCLSMLLVMACTLFAGCSGGDTAGNTQSGSSDTLRFGCFSYSDVLDPGQMINSAWAVSRYGVGECLYRFDDEMNAQPWLSDSYTVSDDHKTWVLHIRDGVKFSNGNDMTAQSVVDEFERIYNMEAENSSKPSKFIDIASITADNEAGTVTIVTNIAYPDLTKTLSYPVFVILDVNAGTDITTQPVGTGPYAIASFDGKVSCIMTKNEYYWNGEVPFDNLQISFINDSTTKALSLQNGDIDLVENITTTSDLDKLKADDNYYVSTTPGIRTGFAYINEAGVLGNDALREAVLQALDDETMCNVTIGGLYTAGYSVLPSSLDYNYDKLTNPYPYDVEAAKQKLDEAGIIDTDGDGIRELDGQNINLRFITYDNRGLSQLAEAVQLQLADIGIGVTVSSSDADTEWNLMVAGEYDLCSSNWTTVGTGDPTEYLANWYSKSEANYCNYKNDEFDACYEQMLTELDSAKIIDLVTEMQQILIDDAAVMVHGYYNSSMVSVKSKISGADIATADYYWITSTIKPAE